MKWVKILEVLAEGGSIKLLRNGSKDGKAIYKVKTNECYDDEDGPMHSENEASSWAGAMALLDKYPWCKLHPDRDIHPKFKAHIAIEVRKRLSWDAYVDGWGPCLGLPSDLSGWEVLHPKRHWKEGYSAMSLAQSWCSGSNTFPGIVQKVFYQHDQFRNAELLVGIPEHKVALNGGGRASHNDIWVLAQNGDSLISIAVEGKVHEPFDKSLKEWYNSNDVKSGRLKRFQFLCNILGLDGKCSIEDDILKYQLFHRAASAIIEAERCGAKNAMMMVHSFYINHEESHFEDYRNFLSLFSINPDDVMELSLVTAPDSVGSNKDIQLHFAWITGH